MTSSVTSRSRPAQDAERLPRYGGWAEIGSVQVEAPYRRRGVATWLLGQAADWLRLAGVDKVLDYAWLDGTDFSGLDYTGYRALLQAAGFRELTRTRRGWTRATRATQDLPLVSHYGSA